MLFDGAEETEEAEQNGPRQPPTLSQCIDAFGCCPSPGDFSPIDNAFTLNYKGLSIHFQVDKKYIQNGTMSPIAKRDFENSNPFVSKLFVCIVRYCFSLFLLFLLVSSYSFFLLSCHFVWVLCVYFLLRLVFLSSVCLSTIISSSFNSPISLLTPIPFESTLQGVPRRRAVSPILSCPQRW